MLRYVGYALCALTTGGLFPFCGGLPNSRRYLSLLA
jgi:hypothetical protein